MTVRILQFGTTGQLARELLAQAKDFDVEITALSRAEADFADTAAVLQRLKGADADLVVLAPDDELTVDVAALAHKNPVSAYAGRRLRGVVRRTYLRGALVDPDHPHGRLLVRDQRGLR